MPEFPYDISAICDQIRLRNSLGKTFSIVVVGEGAKPVGGDMVVKRTVANSPDAIRLGGVSNQVAAQIEGAYQYRMPCHHSGAPAQRRFSNCL